MRDLNTIGIDSYKIRNVIEICDSCLEMLGIDTSDFDSNFYEQLEEVGRWDDISGSVMEAYMETTAILIEDKYPDIKVESYVKGWDSCLYLNGELYQVGDKKSKFAAERIEPDSGNKEYRMAVSKAMYGILEEYGKESLKELYPTVEDWIKDDPEAKFFDYYIRLAAERMTSNGLPYAEIREKLMEAVLNKGAGWSNKFDQYIDKGMNRAEITSDWEAAFEKKTTRELSAGIDYGFSDDELSELASLHRKADDELKKKIEDLLEDCNFSGECSNFQEGNYEEYILSDTKNQNERGMD